MITVRSYLPTKTDFYALRDGIMIYHAFETLHMDYVWIDAERRINTSGSSMPTQWCLAEI